MATTSIWHVEGYLGRVLIYAENPEKTENPAFHAVPDISDAELSGLGDVMAYATDPTKTEQKMFVTGINCRPETARDEMLSIKRGYEKEGGIIAWHGYQSFKPGETTPAVAHEIGVKLAREVFGERFQVVVATHLDRGHLHNVRPDRTMSKVEKEVLPCKITQETANLTERRKLTREHSTVGKR